MSSAPYTQSQMDDAAGKGCVVLLVITILAIISLVAVGVATCKAPEHLKEAEPEAMDAKANPADYVFNDATDMQEQAGYPTGCEGISAAVMLRMNGLDITNEQVFQAMPMSPDGSDFVNAYWGDPATHDGFACMAPCIVKVCRQVTPEGWTCVNLTGTALASLPTPSTIWVTMGYKDPKWSDYEQGGYKLAWNTHCVVMLSIKGDQAFIWDPLKGRMLVDLADLGRIYHAMGSQAVYVTERGYEEEQ